MRYHMPKAQRPLGCNESSECNERFLFKKDLEKHINSVHRKMRFYCTVRGCGKQYKRHDARIRHMTSNHREATILERDDTAVPPTPPTLQSLQTPRVPHISLSPGGSDGAARGPWPAGLSTETSSVSSPVSPRTSFSQFSDSFLDLRSRSGSQSTAPTSVMSSFQKEMPTYATMASMPAHDSRDISKPCRSGMPKHHRLHATSPLPSQRGASKELKTHSAAKGHASSAHISEHLAPSQSKAKRNDEIRLPQRPAGRK
ncbi:hypothetical protein EJ03DRAFT_945 [Teratosphaeria nubilosa]|uniref:C2H2-type domain-containing protein n=1 Tax=Teratosphaeria nubilosa TaxID=161662 RepID=A0A6G1LMP7_9PEZI|nr:hypothetical protein EJ03DRAFT_945 [Teratosphaeria nubilosa]